MLGCPSPQDYLKRAHAQLRDTCVSQNKIRAGFRGTRQQHGALVADEWEQGAISAILGLWTIVSFGACGTERAEIDSYTPSGAISSSIEPLAGKSSIARARNSREGTRGTCGRNGCSVIHIEGGRIRLARQDPQQQCQIELRANEHSR